MFRGIVRKNVLTVPGYWLCNSRRGDHIIDPSLGATSYVLAASLREEDNRPVSRWTNTEAKGDAIRYSLDYTIDWLIRNFELVPDDRIWVRPRPSINAPGWIFAHVVVTEREHVGTCGQGIDDIPADWLRIFRIHRGTRTATTWRSSDLQ